MFIRGLCFRCSWFRRVLGVLLPPPVCCFSRKMRLTDGLPPARVGRGAQFLELNEYDVFFCHGAARVFCPLLRGRSWFRTLSSPINQWRIATLIPFFSASVFCAVRAHNNTAQHHALQHPGDRFTLFDVTPRKQGLLHDVKC